MGVVRMYRCGYNNYYFSLLHLYYIALFFASSIPISLFIFKKCFFVLACYFCEIYSKRC